MKNPSRLANLSFLKAPALGLSVLETLIEQIEKPALIADQKAGKVLIVNSRLTELTSFTRQELCGQDLKTVFPCSEETWAEISLEGTQGPTDIPLKRHSGQPVNVQACTAVIDPQKKLILVSLEPVTERLRRQAEEERQNAIWPALIELASLPQNPESMQALDAVLEVGSRLTGAKMLAVYLGEGKEFLLSRRIVFGDASFLPEQLSPEDLLSINMPHVWAPRRRALSALHQGARVGGLSYLATAPLGRMNARVGLIAAGGIGTPPPDKILNLLDILGSSITSILQNKAVTAALINFQQVTALQQAISNAMLSKIQDGIILLTTSLSILELNTAAEAMLGYGSGQVRGQPVADILVGAGEPVPEFLVSQPGIAFQDMGSHRFFRRDGSLFLADLKAMPVYVNETLERILVVLHDLTEEEQHREQNQKLEQRAVLGELNAIFAHEVRNPINNISTGLQVLALSLPETDPNQDVIARMIQDCERVGDLMKSVLSFIKQKEYRFEPLDLNGVIRRLLDRWRPNMAKFKVKPEVYVEPGTPLIEGDQRALEHVWNNLFSNAIQAMNQNGGTLAIKVRPVTGADGSARVEISISDTGGGISEEVRERIFEPFFTTHDSGTGLGLAITKRIVAAHKGTISVVSVPGGTVFQVQLPTASKPEEENQPQEGLR